jgi:hypothetical protein
MAAVALIFPLYDSTTISSVYFDLLSSGPGDGSVARGSHSLPTPSLMQHRRRSWAGRGH